MDKADTNKTSKATMSVVQTQALTKLLSVLLAALMVASRVSFASATTVSQTEQTVFESEGFTEHFSVPTICSIDDQTFTNMSSAISAVQDGQTILMLRDYDQDSPMLISSAIVTLDLNGYELNITTTTGPALTVTNGGVLMLSDSIGGGEFNVVSTDSETDFGYGVFATAGSQAMVTNATGFVSSACATGLGADIVIYGDAFSYDIGVIAENDSTVSVYGDVIGVNLGVYADDASVSVRNNIMATELDGIHASNCADVTVGGSVLTGVVGVLCTGGSHVTVGGMVITNHDYVKLDEQQTLTFEHGFVDGQKLGYIEYTNNLSYVWVKDSGIYNLTNARSQKTMQLNSVLNAFSEDDYTEQSWDALQTAVENALAEVAAARSIAQVKAVLVPNAQAILVPEQSVGAPGSGDPYGRGDVTLDIALIVTRIVCGLPSDFTPEQRAAVDMDFDGILTMTDVMLIVRRAAGL